MFASIPDELLFGGVHQGGDRRQHSASLDVLHVVPTSDGAHELTVHETRRTKLFLKFEKI